jgi:proliferating cell nuclear antigen
MDENRATLIDLKLDASNFESFQFNSPVGKDESVFIGLTLTHLYKLLKTVKKKDSITLYILHSEPTEIAIQVTPKDNKRVTTSFLKIQRVQNILVDIPTGYNAAPVPLPSSEFQKIYKDILSIGKTVQVSTTGGVLQFDVDAGGIVKRRVEYGNLSTKNENDTPRYEALFDTEQLVKLSKVCNLSQSLDIYTEKNLPLLVSGNVGTLGTISIFVKCKTNLNAH